MIAGSAALAAAAVHLALRPTAKRIGDALVAFNLMNPRIRMVGGIVATNGLPLVLNGIRGVILPTRPGVSSRAFFQAGTGL